AVKKSIKEQNNSRKDAKTERAAKQTKEFFFALLCALASLREILYFFTPSDGRVTYPCVKHFPTPVIDGVG
ncbi:MAG: hypothetical protein ACLQVL_16830, partial [Terriglobia bacterium]